MHPRLIIAIGLSFTLALGVGGGALAQRQRKPQRAQPPKFTGKEFSGTFFDDVRSVLQGERPTGTAAEMAAATPAASPGASAGGTSASAAGEAGAASDSWGKLISAGTLEDAVKNSKLRLDELVASPTKFAGGYVDARREFSLQALMFAIIEQYPGDVRWKRSAAVARDSLARMAANAKVSSPQAYKEAKQRVEDLGELLNGNNLDGTPNSELAWSDIIDRVPLMQLLEWAHQEHINNYSSSAENFKEHQEELQRFAELVAVLGKAAIMEDMPDAADSEYRAIAEQMIQQAMQIGLAVQTDNADLARQAAGQIGQACAKCHDGYR